MAKFKLLFAAVAAVSLSACLDTDLERGFAGAAAGAITANALGGDPIVGAAVGGTAGVLCDDVTTVCR